MSGIRKLTLAIAAAGMFAASGAAIASPAWAAGPGDNTAGPAGCQLLASAPKYNKSTMRLEGSGSRSGCGDSVTYFWVRVYQVIDWWPDSEKAVKGANYLQNGGLTARGNCGGAGQHYTHTSTATGASGDSVESRRVGIC